VTRQKAHLSGLPEHQKNAARSRAGSPRGGELLMCRGVVWSAAVKRTTVYPSGRSRKDITKMDADGMDSVTQPSSGEPEGRDAPPPDDFRTWAEALVRHLRVSADNATSRQHEGDCRAAIEVIERLLARGSSQAGSAPMRVTDEMVEAYERALWGATWDKIPDDDTDEWAGRKRRRADGRELLEKMFGVLGADSAGSPGDKK